MIDVTCPQGALDDEARAEVVEKLTATLLRHEGAPDTERTRAITWVMIHELPAGNFGVGGKSPEKPHYRVMVTTPEGTLFHGPNPLAINQRKKMVRDVTDIILRAEGGEDDELDAARVWCLLTELPDTYWGAMGQVISISDILAYANAPDDGPAPAQDERDAEAALAGEFITGSWLITASFTTPGAGTGPLRTYERVFGGGYFSSRRHRLQPALELGVAGRVDARERLARLGAGAAT